jgi:transposase
MMGEPISLDLRRRIAAAYERGNDTYSGLAERFNVGRATVSRLLRREREGRCLEPEPHGGGHPPRIPPEQYDDLIALVREMPSATRRELADAWEKRFGVVLSVASMGRTLRAAGLTWKKNAFVLKNSSGPTSSSREKRSRSG